MKQEIDLKAKLYNAKKMLTIVNKTLPFIHTLYTEIQCLSKSLLYLLMQITPKKRKKKTLNYRVFANTKQQHLT